MALGIDPAKVVDFSVNLNPYGPCAPVLHAARAADLARYPDPQARAARAAWARALERHLDEIAVGHGAADLLWAIARAFLQPSDRVVIAEPTFSELRYAAAAMGAFVDRPSAREADGFSLRLDELVAYAQGARLLYICSPNNPTGERIAPAALARLAEAVAPTLVVLDQSFVALSDHADDARAALPDNVIRVRSLTKEFACPGLRIGIVVGSAPLVARIEAARPTWATSAPALAALAEAAAAGAFVVDSWRKLRTDRDATRALLGSHGLSPLSSDTSYLLVPVRGEAAAWKAGLLRHNVLVRDCASFGLPRHVRIAALPEAARATLGAALDAMR